MVLRVAKFLVWFCFGSKIFKSYSHSVLGPRLLRLRTKVWAGWRRGLREGVFDRRCYARLLAVLYRLLRSPDHLGFRSLAAGALRRLVERLILRRDRIGQGPRRQYAVPHLFPHRHRPRSGFLAIRRC